MTFLSSSRRLTDGAKKRGIRAEDVTIPVETRLGALAYEAPPAAL